MRCVRLISLSVDDALELSQQRLHPTVPEPAPFVDFVHSPCRGCRSSCLTSKRPTKTPSARATSRALCQNWASSDRSHLPVWKLTKSRVKDPLTFQKDCHPSCGRMRPGSDARGQGGRVRRCLPCQHPVIGEPLLRLMLVVMTDEEELTRRFPGPL